MKRIILNIELDLTIETATAMSRKRLLALFKVVIWDCLIMKLNNNFVTLVKVMFDDENS
jgi:hypothetical protein